MNQQTNVNPAPEPKDAREATGEQRQVQDQLEHLGDDPDGPGLQQSHDQIADESSR